MTWGVVPPHRDKVKACAPALLPLVLAGCTSLAQLAPDEYYFAAGSDPDWSVSLSSVEIRLTIGHAERHQVAPLEDFTFPMVVGHRMSDAFVWESEAGGRSIAIESRRGPCRSAQGIRFPRSVRVRLDNRAFQGCGGRQTSVRG